MTTPQGSLSAATLTSLRAFFDGAGHRPSAEHWEALGDIAQTLESMAGRTCAPKVFLSAIDPGVGKSQTVIHFARALVASPEHRHVGMLICVGRIKEASDIAEALSDLGTALAVLTSNEATNERAKGTPGDAQVLVTTKQRIERATDGRTFAAASGRSTRGRQDKSVSGTKRSNPALLSRSMRMI